MLRCKLHLLVKNIALNLMLRIGPNLSMNMMLFILINVQKRTALIIILVNLLEDQISYLCRHVVVNEHHNASYDDFKIIGSGFRNNMFKRKVAEALLIKELQSTLNIQEKSAELKLFN